MTEGVMQDYDPRAVPPTSLEEQARLGKLAAKAASPKTLAERAAEVFRLLQDVADARMKRFASLIQASSTKTVEVGTEWWYEPSLAGHEGTWQPDIVRVVRLNTDPMPPSNPDYPPPPIRQYVVRLPGGTHLFANDASLFYINLARTGPRV